DGAHVDVSMYEPILAVMAATIAGWEPSKPVPARSGSRVAGGAPRNVYRTADDRYVAVSGTTDAQGARVLALLGRDDPPSRARVRRATDRLHAADELDALVAEWAAAHDRDDVVAQLLDARVGVTPVNDVAEVLDDPHVVARGSVVTVGHGDDAVVVPAPLPRV